MPTQVSLLDGALASAGTLAIQTNGTTSAITISSAQVATFVNNPIMTGLTASRAVFTDGSKGLTSNAITGTGNVVMSASPTLTGTIDGAALTLSSSLTLSGGTANGVLYLNGSKVATSGSALTFDGSYLNLSRGSAGTLLNLTDGVAQTLRIATTASAATIDNPSAGALGFLIAGSEQMRLTSTGLGIGTSSPSYKLQVAGTSGTVGIGVTGTIASGDNALYIAPSSVTGSYNFISGSVSATGTAGTSLSNTNNSNGAAHSRLDLGVGGASGGDPKLTYTVSGVLNWSVGVDNSDSDKFKISGSDSPGTSDYFIIDTSGRVGIGGTTVTDGHLLNIQGSTASNNIGIVLNKTNATAQIWGITNTGPLAFYNYTASSEAMRIDSSGNLGIGTTSPSEKLQVNGSSVLFQNTSGTFDLKLYQTGRYDGRITVNSSGMEISQRQGLPLLFLTSDIERARIDSSGNMGIGTTSTGSDRLRVVGGQFRVTKSTAYAANPLDSSSFSGAVLVNTNDGSGDLSGLAMYVNSSYGAGCGIFAKQTASNTADLLFYTGTGVVASNVERARIDSSGNLLVGTTSSAANSGTGVKLLPSGYVYVVAPSTTSDTYNYYNSTAGAYRFYVTNAGVINATSTTITAISDQRLKENIQDIDVGLDAVMALKPRKFDWKAGKGKDKKGDRGWIAQEFEQVFPDMITTWKDEPPEGEEPYKAVNADLIPVLVKAIQELKAEFDAYKATHP